ncbi:MAG: 3D domain-containing protein [Alkalibacterium sp.]|uniref:3D domain-containing protein n=1 Tax=Alkalibacterium sp. TaxID=1872447 RepID=UPI0039710398
MKKNIMSLAVIGLAFLHFNYSQPVSADSLNNIKDQQKQTTQEIQSLRKEVGTVIEETNTLNDALITLEENVSAKEAAIEETKVEIAEQEEVVKARLEQASDRLQSLQVNEVSQNIVLTVLESESISDLFNRALVIMRLTDAGNQQIELAEEEGQKLIDLNEKLVDTRLEIEAQQEEAVIQKKALDSKVSSLQVLIQENEAELSSLVEREAAEVSRIEDARRLAREAAEAKSEQEVATSSSGKQVNTKPVVAKSAASETETSASKKVESKPAVKEESKPAQTSGRTLQVEATGYSTKQPGLSSHTYLGIDLRVNPRVIAVDPSVIPLGSMVEVEGMGVYTAGDTGSAINGNIIDIHFKTVAEALQWGRRQVTVRILN